MSIMRKIAELLKVYFKDQIRNPVTVGMSILWVLSFFVFLLFVFEHGGLSFGVEQGFNRLFIASYLVFIPAYIGIFGVSNAVIQDKEKGLLKAYRSSRLSEAEYFSAKLIAASISGLLASGVVLVASFLISPIEINFMVIVIAIVLTTISHGAISLLLTSKVNDSENHNIVFQFLMILLIVGTPVFYPSSVVPDPLNLVQQFFPLTHSVELVRAMATGSLSLSLILQKTGILTGFSVLLLGIAYRIYPY